MSSNPGGAPVEQRGGDRDARGSVCPTRGAGVSAVGQRTGVRGPDPAGLVGTT